MKQSRAFIWKWIPALLSAFLVLGVLTAFSACGMKDDGTWMKCHGAQTAVAKFGGGMTALFLLAAVLRNKVLKTTLFVLGIIGSMFKYENLDADAIVSSVMIRVAPGYDSETVAAAIRDKVDGVSVATATNMVSGIADSLNRISGTLSALIVAFWLLGMLMTVLLFTLMMNARVREFASLRAMGASRGILSGIVVREALAVNLLGGAIGNLLTGVILFSFNGLIGEPRRGLRAAACTDDRIAGRSSAYIGDIGGGGFRVDHRAQGQYDGCWVSAKGG